MFFKVEIRHMIKASDTILHIDLVLDLPILNLNPK